MRFYFLLFLIAPLCGTTQGLKLNDYAGDYKKNGIQFRRTIEIEPSGDTILIDESHFNVDGMTVEYIDYFARNRILNTQKFEYEKSRYPVRSFVDHLFYKEETVELIHRFNEKGQLVSRECPVEIRHFWAKEEYTYDHAGRMVSCTRYTRDGEVWTLTETESFSPYIHSGENSPSFIHDERGLLLIRQMKSAATGSGTLQKFIYNE